MTEQEMDFRFQELSLPFKKNVRKNATPIKDEIDYVIRDEISTYLNTLNAMTFRRH